MLPASKANRPSNLERSDPGGFEKLVGGCLLLMLATMVQASEEPYVFSKPISTVPHLPVHVSLKEKNLTSQRIEGRQSPFQSFGVDDSLDTNMQIHIDKSEQDPLDPEIKHEPRISLEVKEVPVREVLTRLAIAHKTNIVLSEKIEGNMSLHLSGVTWDQALDVILMSRSLGKQYYKEVLLVAPIEELMERNQKAWQSKEEEKKRRSLHTALIQIHHGKVNDLARFIRDKPNTLLSERGSVTVDARSNTLLIRDDAIQLDRIKKLIRHLDVPLRQVLIEARIVNVTKEFARDLGLRFGVSKPSQFNRTFEGSIQASTDTGKSKRTSDLTRDLTDLLNLDLTTLPLAASSASIGLSLAKLGAGILLDLELSALESEGQGKVISSPHLITLNQQMAVIEAGEEIPYQELTPHGATAVSFKKAVLSLKVTPHITPDNKIYMDLKINQDIPSPKVLNGVPTILTKEIQTNVLVNDNQTIVLGGIYKQNNNHEMNRVPWLGDLPLIKMLFRNQSKTVRNEELLIFITPRVLSRQPTMREKLPKA